MIIVFGSCNADMFLPVQAFPKPGETVLTTQAITKPGGKGCNQAVAAARAGAKVAFVGRTGTDPLAEVPRHAMQDAGIDIAHVASCASPTGLAFIMVDKGGENSIVVASGANFVVEADDAPDALLSSSATLLMQMEVRHEANHAIIRKARKHGSRIVLNYAPACVPGHDASFCPLAQWIGGGEASPLLDYLILNEEEAQTVARALGLAPANAETTAHQIALQIRATTIVTLGKAGVIAVTPDAQIVEVGTLSITPVDTTGAGDAFCGIFTAGIDAGLPLATAMQRASAGAGLACLKVGAQEALPDRSAIDEAAARVNVRESRL